MKKTGATHRGDGRKHVPNIAARVRGRAYAGARKLFADTSKIALFPARSRNFAASIPVTLERKGPFFGNNDITYMICIAQPTGRWRLDDRGSLDGLSLFCRRKRASSSSLSPVKTTF